MSTYSFVDTHCHIHEPQYNFNISEAIEQAKQTSVDQLILVGTSVDSSRQAIDVADKYNECRVALGVHPHEADDFFARYDESSLKTMVSNKSVVAIGEIGLDYFYEHSDRKAQEKLFRIQLAIAEKNNLPVIFHVRGSRNNGDDVFDDLWRILDDYPGIKKGVMHSFTASTTVMREVIRRGFLIGLNGIMTFSKDEDHKELARSIPLESFILETDAPYLTPEPIRGTINTPKNVKLVAEFLAEHRGEKLEDIARATTLNAKNLFTL